MSKFMVEIQSMGQTRYVEVEAKTSAEAKEKVLEQYKKRWFPINVHSVKEDGSWSSMEVV